MLIDCPSCARSYTISRAAIGETGRGVVCPRCATRWFVEPSLDQTMDIISGPGLDAMRFAGHRDLSALGGATRNASPGVRPMKRASWTPLAASLACLFLAMGLIAKRTEIVRAVPRVAGFYAAIGLPVNIRALDFANVKATPASDVAHAFQVSGTIRNLARARAPMPRITFEIRDADGATLTRWTETAPKRVLASDETVAFASQAPGALPAGAKDVVVHFDASETQQATIGSLIHKTP